MATYINATKHNTLPVLYNKHSSIYTASTLYIYIYTYFRNMKPYDGCNIYENNITNNIYIYIIQVLEYVCMC